jgi:anaerobic selenocysteine-containing dehydrogenase
MSEFTRRDFLKTSAFLGGTAALTSMLDVTFNKVRATGDGLQSLKNGNAYHNNDPENIIYSICLNCHTACAIKGKVVDGVLVKIDGNPYSVTNRLPNLDYDIDPKEAAHYEGKVCPKGQAGVPVLYDPYRVRKVLKRAGKRGENRWVTIDFNQAIDEIVNGGDLFGEGPVPGLKDIFKLRDPDLGKALAADAKAVAKGDMSIDEFKKKHADHLDILINPDHPDLGPVNNQFVFQAGRIEHGRKELGKRFTKSSFGSVNFFEHTTICEQSHHIAFKEVTRNYKTGSKKEHLKPDILNAELVIFFGTGAFEANFGPPSLAEKVTDSLVNRKNFGMVVIDPRMSKTAAQADQWVPIKPGTDAALALGMIRWIIENKRYDKTYLENPNADAAKADNETSWTDATHLVRTDEMVFLTAEDAGLTPPSDGKPPFRVVMTNSGPALADSAKGGTLEHDGQVNGIPVKTAFTLLKERALEKTLAEYSAICDVSVDTIVDLADEFTSHGKKAVAELYRGPVQHTNGYYNGQAIILLNVLIGNAGWTGGWSAGGGHWHEDGSKPGAPFPKSIVAGGAPGGIPSFGVKLTREGSHYEDTTLFKRDGYPAKRTWYPFTGNVYQEIIPSAMDGYPYPIKALLIHKGTPALSCPAGHKQIPALMDPKVLPLVIACDIVIGETSMYADYIFPDLTYMERWATSHASPDNLVPVSKVRQPIAGPIPEIVTVDGEEMPLSLEALMIAVGKKLKLPGFGKGGFGKKGDFNRPEDFYLKLVANIAAGDKEGAADAVPEASEAEMALFRKARRHLPKAIFDEAKWKAAVGNDESLWRRVVYVLNRGGRFASFAEAYKGDKLAHGYKGPFNLFVERVSKARQSMTGERFDGLPHYEPPRNGLGQVVEDKDYPLQLITFKEITGGQSRTIAAYWLSTILPENFLLINQLDADKRGIRDGDLVKVISKVNPDGVWDLGHGNIRPVVGKAKVIQGIRPGTVAASWHYGHWAYGSEDVVMDGQVVAGDPRRGTGLCTNAVLRVDDAVGNMALSDPIGGSVSFYDTRVEVVKA